MKNKEPTFSQLKEQEVSSFMNGSDDLPTVLVPRKAGDISVGRFSKRTGLAYFSDNGEDKEKPLSRDTLSDQRQAELAEELAADLPQYRAIGGGALDAIGVSVGEDPWKREGDQVELTYNERGMIVMPNWDEPAPQEVETMSSDEEPNPELVAARRALRDAKAARKQAQDAGRGEDSMILNEQVSEYNRQVRELEGRS